MLHGAVTVTESGPADGPRHSVSADTSRAGRARIVRIHPRFKGIMNMKMRLSQSSGTPHMTRIPLPCIGRGYD
jgi:hypothetical protein